MANYITKDSGERVEFSTGSRRDTDVGKPRIELIPNDFIYRLEMACRELAINYQDIGYLLSDWYTAMAIHEHIREIYLSDYKLSKHIDDILSLLIWLEYPDYDYRTQGIPPELMLRLAGLLSRGAIKYDDNNWQLGQPYSRVISSLWRHYWQHLASKFQGIDIEEDHYAATFFNLMCIWYYESAIASGKLDAGIRDIWK